MPTEKNNENIGNDYFSRHTKLDIYFIITTCTVKVSPPKVAGRNFKSQSTKSLTLLNLLGTPKRDSKTRMRKHEDSSSLHVSLYVCVCTALFLLFYIHIPSSDPCLQFLKSFSYLSSNAPFLLS